MLRGNSGDITSNGLGLVAGRQGKWFKIMRIQYYCIQASAELYEIILDSYHPADRLMSQFFRHHHTLKNQDRAFVAETVYGMLRHRSFLECAQNFCDNDYPISTMVYMYLAYQDKEGKHQLPLEAQEIREVKKALEKAKFFLSSKDPLSRLSLQYSIPMWVLQKWATFFSMADMESLCRSLQEPAPLFVRTNTLKITRAELKKRFRTAEGWETQETHFSPVGLLFKNKTHVFKSQLFQKGLFEVQDEGSQLISYLTEVRPGQKVLDACAGGGGKTLHLATLMHNKGMIYASDTSEYRLKELKPRTVRAGVSNIRTRFLSGKSLKGIRQLKNMFDVVLVDAPCSGMGTLRRNPDVTLRLTYARIRELTMQQSAILSQYSMFVKAGGRFVYSTCSLLPEENEEIIASFLKKHSEFHVEPASAILQKQGIVLPMPISMKDSYLILYPHLHGTDGFFAAVLIKS